jgi:lipopolysaccharide/colanic/teichoic acid biosynthesis glycosyltransferase
MDLVRSSTGDAGVPSRQARAEAWRASQAALAVVAEAPRLHETDATRARVAAPAEPAESPRAAAVIDVVPRSRSERLNRIVNIFIALVALVLLSPVLLLIALAIRLTSPGPVIYQQTRVGLDRRWNRARAMFDRRAQDLGGRVFAIYKFRSMSVDAEHSHGAVWATQNDARVTPVGRVLRKFRLDELPQLFNVIRGDMNIVGPRPERPSIVLRLREQIDEYPMRQRTKPGITGWAQINHSYDASIDDVRTKVRYDLEYLQRQSIVEDFKIMFRTLPVMIFKKGGW